MAPAHIINRGRDYNAVNFCTNTHARAHTGLFFTVSSTVHQFFRVKLRKMPTRGANPPIIRTSGKQAAQRLEKLRQNSLGNYC
jgi:hypothetical protein